ncbi:hypothetical protein HYH02_007883 [Chlamydomonas schloesseri]|uniref:Ankyrin repeat domain-containing protein n=1 Tax=Chlamydomonas schloesseri TaxID=2026947 RepID=A0A835WGS3_9CHLO|nr:hypothetical protein HYH02_007883 [Chlamydomonas schloesseri]|eukprot:KAG2447137.1 hypothetical protein HYH02_007883 [Chlamydomonas schloesseri]
MPERDPVGSCQSARTGAGGGSPSLGPDADGSRVWLPELVERYARYLPPNEVALTLRLVSRATAAQFRGRHHTLVRLSEPCPPPEFTAHWGDVQPLRALSRERRRQLLQLTAAAGVVDNLRLLLDRHGAEHCRTGLDVLLAAAKAGQVAVCRWLAERLWGGAGAAGPDLHPHPHQDLALGLGLGLEFATQCDLVQQAGMSGSRETCEWALAVRPVPRHSRAHVKLLAAGARGAVGAGHTGLMDWCLGQLPEALRQPPAAAAAAGGHQQQQPHQLQPQDGEGDDEDEDAEDGLDEDSEEDSEDGEHGGLQGVQQGPPVDAPAAAAGAGGAGAGPDAAGDAGGANGAGAGAAAAAGAALMGEVAGLVMMAADMAHAMGLGQMAEAMQGAAAAMDGAGVAAAAAAADDAGAAAGDAAAAAGGGAGAGALAAAGAMRRHVQEDAEPWDAEPRLAVSTLLRLPQLLEAAAEGAPSADTLEQLHRRFLDTPGRALDAMQRARLVVAAARCKADDWRARVEGLEARRYPRPSRACAAAVGAAPGEEGLARLRWLVGRGYPLEQDVVSSAAEANNAAVMSFVLGEGVRVSGIHFILAAVMAARSGALDCLRLLHAHALAAAAGAAAAGEAAGGDGPGGPQAQQVPWHLGAGFACAIEGGHVPVVEWMLSTMPTQLDMEHAQQAAAAGGHRQLVTLLAARGVPLSDRAFVAAAEAGDEGMMQWLVREAGCPMGDDGSAYVQAAYQGDVAALAALRRLGCPWRPRTFTRAVYDPHNNDWGADKEELLWLLEAGCPVNWRLAIAAAEEHRDRDLATWLRQQELQRSTWVRGRRLRPRGGRSAAAAAGSDADEVDEV